MVFHPLAQNNLVRVVVAEGQRIGAVLAFVLNLRNIAKKSSGHVISSFIFG